MPEQGSNLTEDARASGNVLETTLIGGSGWVRVEVIDYQEMFGKTLLFSEILRSQSMTTHPGCYLMFLFLLVWGAKIFSQSKWPQMY